MPTTTGERARARTATPVAQQGDDRQGDEGRPEDGDCPPGSAVRAAHPHPHTHSHPHDRAELGREQVTGMLADLSRRLRERYGTSDERRLDEARRRAKALVVPVRVHVVHDGRAGRLSKGLIDRQISTMNAAYGGKRGGVDTGVRFRLRSYGYVDSPAWFHNPERYERPMKKRLRKGGRGTLNLYTAAVGTDVLGFSTFPQWYERDPYMDGVVIDYRSVPHGTPGAYNRGYTAVHETGHWLGLFHTFEGGCTAPGDGVADTPYERSPARGCPEGRDTCPQRGRDPVHNFMNYSHDTCMREFTAGQGRRIRAAWAAYRAGASARHPADSGARSDTEARSVGAAG